MRFACELGFDIQPELYRAAKANVHLLKDIAKERIRQELDKILMADVKYGIKGAHRRGLMMLKDLGAIPYTFPLLGREKASSKIPNIIAMTLKHTTLLPVRRPVLTGMCDWRRCCMIWENRALPRHRETCMGMRTSAHKWR